MTLRLAGKAYRLEMKTVARPAPAAKQILVRVRAVSLNQRDLLVTRAQYGGTGGGTMAGKVPLSDGAGEVVAVGAGATRFRVGDRVAGIYVGSRADFEAMNRFMSQHTIRPIIDRVFPFEQPPQAFELMDNGSYLGKIVIKL